MATRRPLVMVTGVQRELASGDLLPWTTIENLRVVDRAYAEYTSAAQITAFIPPDDTIPQITEGTQILSVTITPKNTTNRLRFRASAGGSADLQDDGISLAAFRNGVSNALGSSYGVLAPYAGGSTFCYLEGEFVPGSTSALTLSIRAGGAAGNITINGYSGVRFFGGSWKSTL